MIWVLIVLYLVAGFIASALAYKYGIINEDIVDVSLWVFFWCIIIPLRPVWKLLVWLWWKIAGEYY